MTGRHIKTGLSVLAGLIAATTVAAAQDAPPTPEPSAPAATEPAPPASSAPATAETPPAQSATQPAASGETPAGAAPQAASPDKEALPEVEVIQKKAEPPPVREVQKPAKKKPVAKTEPSPAPAPAEPVEPVEAAADAAPAEPAPPAVTTVRMSPIGGSEIPADKVPSAVSTVSSASVERDGSRQLQNVLQQNVPGVILSDTAGSGFRTDVSYRGFDASPVGGRAQGLAVYMNGIRINEAFGDTVNWDAIPSIAISDISVISNNPVFGLNAIGGAVSVIMKDGFNYQGSEIDVMGGSFGRKQIAVQSGGNSGGFGAYVAAEGLEEDGFRDFSEAEVRRMFTDLGWKGSAAEFHLSFTGARSVAGVVTAAPRELLGRDWALTFTNPQDTTFEVWMPSISGSVQATETLTLSGLGYYRNFEQNVIDGNLSEVDECDDAGPNAGFLCLTEDGVEERVRDAAGNDIASAAIDDPLGSIERIDQKAESYGGSLQAVEKSRIFGRPNQFLVGASYDHGEVKYSTSSELGSIGPKFVVQGSGIIVVEPDDLTPRELTTENDYYGVYLSNTLDVTDELAMTVGGRYNHATIKLTDLTGDFPELNTTNKYERFNPMVGATYKFMPGLSIYGGYSEANRAPTAAELGCAEPENPCLIESFLTDDPPLKQVVSHSYEIGLRGEIKSYDKQKLNWSLGYFRTLNTDDILNVAATTTGRGYFLNGGDTLRQGLEAAIAYESDRLQAYVSYALVDATYQDDLILPAPNTPGAEDCPITEPGGEEASCNFVQSGDHLPGIPRHRFKAGIGYWVTPKWKIGTDLVAASDQFFFGDDANNNQTLPGYTRVDLNTSYDVNENVQFYGLIKNLFDQRYGLYGTFFDPAEANEAAEPSGVTLSNPRSITPAAPFAAYGGMKLKF